MDNIKKIMHMCPFLAIIYFLLDIIFYIFQYVEVLITQKIVIDLQLEPHILILDCIFLILIYILICIRGSIVGIVRTKMQFLISKRMYPHLYQSVNEGSLLNLDKALYLQELKLGKEAIKSKCLDNFCIISEVISIVISLSLVCGKLWEINFIYIVVFIIMALLHSIYIFLNTKDSIKLVEKLNKLSRKHIYFFTIGQMREYAKELRSYDLNKWIEIHRHNVYMEMRDKHVTFSLKWIKKSIVWVGIMFFLEGLLYGLLFLQKKIGTISIDQIVLVIQSNGLFLSSFMLLISTLSNLSKGKVYINSLKKILNNDQKNKDSKTKETLTKKETDVLLSMRDVNFSYDTDLVLKQINLSVNRGEKIAIVGKNGSGKSTLAKIILGLIVPDGKVTFYTKKISAVFQDFAMFKVSLRENIAAGDIRNVGFSKEIENALVRAEGKDILDKMSEGIDTELGKEFNDCGMELSGGEWQKVAIARGIFGKSDLLVLDEPTAAIDAMAEYKQFQALFRELEGKSMIIISHRLGIMKEVDRILYLENGEIVEEGTHEELMRKQGHYAQLYKAQAKWYEG